MFVEGLLEVRQINRYAVISAQFFRQLDGKAVGIIQPERDPAAKGGLIMGLHLLNHLVELSQATIEGLLEFLLLSHQLAHDPLAVALQLGIDCAVLPDDGLGYLR